MRFKYIFVAFFAVVAAMLFVQKATLRTTSSDGNNKAKQWKKTQEQLASEFLSSRYSKLKASLENLHEKTVSKNCATKGAPYLQQATVDVLLGWAKIEMIHFGPIDHEMGYTKTYFWPDKHKAMSRHLNKLRIDLRYNQVRPVQELPLTVTGLQAIEHYVFAKDAFWFWKKPSHACKMLAQITTLHSRRIQNTLASWQKWKADPKQQKSLAREFVQASADFLEKIEEIKIPAAKKNPAKKHRRKNLEAPNAGLSAIILRENFLGLAELFGDPNNYLGKLLAKEDTAVFKKIKDKLAKVTSLAEQLEPNTDSIRSILSETQKLKELYLKNVPSVLGVQMGFNASDGD